MARELRDRRLRLSLARLCIMLAFFVLLVLGGAQGLRDWALGFPGPSWASASLFFFVLYAVGNFLVLPFTYVGGRRWERAFGLSTQSLRSWAADLGKSFLLGLGSLLAAGNVLLWLMAIQPTWWWILLWALGLGVSLVIGFLAPILLAPLFFRFRPLQDPALRSRFESLAARAGVPVVGVFEMAASAKTRRSNAAIMGFGRTRRVVVTDTMLHEYAPDEIEAVLAHELAHQKFRDPLGGFLATAVSSLVILGVAAFLYSATYATAGFRALDDLAGLPLLAFYGSVASAILAPAELAWSRRREARADRFSLETTGNSAAFASAMVKLHDKNLGVAHPKAWEVWLFFTHPPGRARVEMARSLAASPRVS